MMSAENYQEALRKLQEIAAECVLMDARQYEDFRAGALQACNEKAKPFLCRVLSIIDTEKAVNGCQ